MSQGLVPRRTEIQMVTGPIRDLVFAGTDTELKVGDRLLAVDGPQREALKVVGVSVEQPPLGSTGALTSPSGTVIEVVGHLRWPRDHMRLPWVHRSASFRR